MTAEEAVVVKAAYAVNQLGEIKRFEAIVERERLKVEKRLQEHLRVIEEIKKDLVRLVANEAEEVRQIGEMCGLIRRLNEILDYEKNMGVLRHG